MTSMKIKGKARRVLWAWMFLADWFGNKPIVEVEPDEITKTLSMLGFSLIENEKK